MHNITPKKLWVAAIDITGQPIADASHPAFYLPGQELLAGNSRGFWALDPCKMDGEDCEAGDECCNGYCQPNRDGELVCSNTLCAASVLASTAVLPRSVVVACVSVVLGCGAKSPVRGATASTPGEACPELASHVASVVKASGPSGRAPGHPLIVELWTSLYVDACRQDSWSEQTLACYRGARSIADFNACEAAQPEVERAGLERLTREARPYLPYDVPATATREEIQAQLVVPVWGYPPGAGTTFASCDAYAEVLATLRSCASYTDPHLRERIAILEMQREQFVEMSPRLQGMWLGYCEAEAAARRARSPECFPQLSSPSTAPRAR